MKIAIWWGRNETFDNERFESVKEDFSDGGNEYSFDCWVGFFSIPRVSHIVSESQLCDIFGKTGDALHMILWDNPARHGSVLRGLILIELLQISHNCVTECTLQAKFFLKLI